MSTVAALVCVASSVVAQAQAPPSNYEHLKGLEWMIGTWESESEAQDGIPGLLPKGDKMNLRLDCAWRLNKNAIGVEYTIKAKGKNVLTYNGMIGWHPAEKQIIAGGFDSLGGHARSLWTKEGDGWKFESKSIRGNGTGTSGTTVISDISEDSMTGQGVNRKRDGEDQPDAPKVVWKRVK